MVAVLLTFALRGRRALPLILPFAFDDEAHMNGWRYFLLIHAPLRPAAAQGLIFHGSTAMIRLLFMMRHALPPLIHCHCLYTRRMLEPPEGRHATSFHTIPRFHAHMMLDRILFAGQPPLLGNTFNGSQQRRRRPARYYTVKISPLIPPYLANFDVLRCCGDRWLRVRAYEHILHGTSLTTLRFAAGIGWLPRYIRFIIYTLIYRQNSRRIDGACRIFLAYDFD